MRLQKLISALVLAVALSVGAAWAVEQTCCEKAAEAGKECRRKCCVAAHKEGKSCAKCNPQKQDQKFLKKGGQNADGKQHKGAGKN